jgi:uncharacterized protein YndB with AHSA1/START domain
MAHTGSLPRPDLTSRPYSCTIEADLHADPTAIYRAWTKEFDRWFARPGTLSMRAEPDAPFFFETEHEGGRHAHYGRFLALDQDRLVELTWVTGGPGTHGAETVVRLELEPRSGGTHVHLSHTGFSDEADAERHRDAWPQVLAHLDATLSS